MAFERNKDTLLCPAHEVLAKTYSALVARVLDVVQQLGYTGPVVWDHVDVPGNFRRHFDMVLLLQTGAKRFEIDGRWHFSHWPLPNDIVKDALMNQIGAGMLRLHHEDEPLWGPAIQQFCDAQADGTRYTASYQDLLDDDVPVHHILPW
jgi:hypothetical protein